MKTTARRYTTPATHPPLVGASAAPRTYESHAPLLCLSRPGNGHAPLRLVTFEWGRVATPAWRR